MCSYENLSDTNIVDFVYENWEENLWQNVQSPSSNSSNTSISYSQKSDSAVHAQPRTDITNYRYEDYQMETSSTYLNVEPSSMLSPALNYCAPKASQACINMSTYFSTFNPSATSQFHEATSQNDFVKIFQSSKSHNGTGNRLRHQARINSVARGNGNFKSVIKRKRKRTIFTTEQLQVLEEVYSKRPYVTRDERQVLSQQLQVNDKSVKIWFQNRRLKNKRADDQDIQDDNQCSIFDRLNTVESKLNERTDEFGYVTLDDKIMKDLVNVIDDYFINHISPVEKETNDDNSPIYEPISPASTSDSCEANGSPGQYYEPNNIVKDLLDIESILTIS